MQKIKDISSRAIPNSFENKRIEIALSKDYFELDYLIFKLD